MKKFLSITNCPKIGSSHILIDKVTCQRSLAFSSDSALVSNWFTDFPAKIQKMLQHNAYFCVAFEKKLWNYHAFYSSTCEKEAANRTVRLRPWYYYPTYMGLFLWPFMDVAMCFSWLFPLLFCVAFRPFLLAVLRCCNRFPDFESLAKKLY